MKSRKIKKRYIIFIVLILSFVLNNQYKQYKAEKDNELYTTYQEKSEYEKKYPVSDYVNNELNANKYIRRFIGTGMINFENFTATEGLNNKLKLGFQYFIHGEKELDKYIKDAQYVETSAVQLEELPDDQKDELHDYQYVGVDKDGNEVSGYASLFIIDPENYSIAISYLNPDLTVNKEKARLLSDDSNAEKLAYDIIEESQKLYGTDLDPQAAALKFYNSSIENIAGAISYHAIVTLYLADKDPDSAVLEHAATTNISLVDHDSFFVNRAY